MADIPLKDITDEFIRGFEHYLKTNKPCSQNATVKYLKNLKKIIRLALANHWIVVDPFFEIRLRQTATNRAFFLEEEIKVLMNKEFTIPRLETVRDIFIFCCFTGLAFSDVQHLTAEHIIRGVNGNTGYVSRGRRRTICVIFLCWKYPG